MGQVTKLQVEYFLNAIDREFQIPLSQKCDLKGLAQKFYEYGTFFVEQSGDQIVSMVAGYTNDLSGKKAYVSVVGTLPEATGKGYATRLLKEFIQISTEKGMKEVHLYTVPTNIGAIYMYKKIGFEELYLEDESRPQDMHLVYYIKQ